MRNESFKLYTNDFVNIIYDACSLCYKSTKERILEERLEYIENKVKLGHESVLEHSNLIMMLVLNKDDINIHKDLIEVMTASRHINYNIKEDHNLTYVLMGGSIRAYKNIFRNIKNGNNMVLSLIKNRLYDTCKEFYYDFIISGIFNYRSFMHSELYEAKSRNQKINEYYNIVNMDDINIIMEKINFITNDKTLFEVDDILDMVTVTVYFKRISRITSQQLTRHRNAISQKSQRYVDEENGICIHPEEFKEDLKKKVNIYRHNINEKELLQLYKSLREIGYLKEDARYYLPQNINTELYVTFTLRNLIHFINLRTDKSAQAEIRNLATLLERDIKENYNGILDEDMSVYLLPKYVLSENNYKVEDAFITTEI